MKVSSNYFNISVILTILYLFNPLSGQQNFKWLDISLTDSINYIQFDVNTVCNDKYPPSNLFDGNFNTCWISGSYKNNAALFLKLPESNNIVMTIFPGYAKSKELHSQNARPKKIRISVYAAVNPDGYVSEIGVQYKAVKFEQEQIVHLADSFETQSIPLDLSQKELTDFANAVSKTFDARYHMPKAEQCFILKMEILESYHGNRYKDICISELFFNDRIMTFHPAPIPQILKVYLNSNEQTLLLDNNLNKHVEVYRDTSSVLQIIDISKNKKYAILISMPAEIQGRAETSYLLVDLINKTIFNSQLEKISGNYVYGNAKYFKTTDNDRLFLMYYTNEGEFDQLELK